MALDAIALSLQPQRFHLERDVKPIQGKFSSVFLHRFSSSSPQIDLRKLLVFVCTYNSQTLTATSRKGFGRFCKEKENDVYESVFKNISKTLNKQISHQEIKEITSE